MEVRIVVSGSEASARDRFTSCGVMYGMENGNRAILQDDLGKGREKRSIRALSFPQRRALQIQV